MAQQGAIPLNSFPNDILCSRFNLKNENQTYWYITRVPFIHHLVLFIIIVNDQNVSNLMLLRWEAVRFQSRDSRGKQIASPFWASFKTQYYFLGLNLSQGRSVRFLSLHIHLCIFTHLPQTTISSSCSLLILTQADPPLEGRSGSSTVLAGFASRHLSLAKVLPSSVHSHSYRVKWQRYRSRVYFGHQAM